MTATVGVLRFGSTLATTRGNTPARAIPYHMRVATFWVARLAAMTEVNMAKSAMDQTAPHTRWAITKAGSSADVGSLPSVRQHQPMAWHRMTLTVLTRGTSIAAA